MKVIVRGLVGLVLVAGMLFGVMLFGFRTQNPAILRRAHDEQARGEQVGDQDRRRRRIRLRVEHRGRTSGTEYVTPIAAIPTDDGFVVVLPSAPRPTGSATCCTTVRPRSSTTANTSTSPHRS
ncbi:MAG: hypothetical protein R2697_19695 [Ilumatobacteraceae bacterium]